jgi:hypothetical protein
MRSDNPRFPPSGLVCRGGHELRESGVCLLAAGGGGGGGVVRCRLGG